MVVKKGPCPHQCGWGLFSLDRCQIHERTDVPKSFGTDRISAKEVNMVKNRGPPGRQLAVATQAALVGPQSHEATRRRGKQIVFVSVAGPQSIGGSKG